MTVQTNLSAAINAYIQSTFLGTLTEISASKINLTSLLEIQQTLADPSGAQTVVPAFLFTSTITRVNNVLAYAANTVYGGALQLTSSVVPVAGQWIIITDIEVIFNLAALPPGMAGFQLYTYGVTPPSNVLDTGAFSLPAGDRASIIYPNGLSLGNAALARGGGSVTVQMNNINVPIQLSGASSFFAYLVSIAAFTPAAALETATLRVRAIAL